MDEFKNKSVNTSLRELEYGLIKENENAVLSDVNGSIARNLWKQIRLWNRERAVVSMARKNKEIMCNNGGFFINFNKK